MDAQATAADREAVAADKNAVAANRTAAETAAESAKTDAERIAALDTYSKREADELLAGKADQPYARAEGACIHIPDSAGGMLGGLVICGNSVQDGTPSPDAPVEIQNVQSPVALTVCGANLINDTPNAAVVNRGVTFSAANGGGTMIVGTSTATFAQSTREKYGFFRLPAGTYTAFASVDGDTGGATIAAQIFSKETNAAIKNVYMGKPTQIVLDGGLVAVSIAVYESGVTLDCVARVMLVPGETAAPYEPYAGQAYSIPLVAADTETYPDALELCRVGDVCDSLERRDGVWGVNKAAGQDSPLWIPLSDEAQDVLDSVRLPAGVANIFATNSPAPDLELTYRQTVISLPTPTQADAGKVPVVTATGNGYELTTLEIGANYSRTFTVEEAVDAYAITDINPAEYCRFVVTMRNTEYQDAVTFKIVVNGKRLSTTIAMHSNVIAVCNYSFDQQFAMTIRMQGNNLTALLSSVAAIRYADSAAAGLHFTGHLGAGTIIQVWGYKL